MPIFKLKAKLSKERFSMGLDIGTQTIKMAKLRFIQDAVELSGFDLEPFSALELGEILKRIKESGRIDTLNLSFSGPSTVIRYVNFPKMNKDELQHALKFEAQKHIPFAVNEVNLDGFVLKENLPDNKMLVMLAAVKKDLVEQRLKMMQDVGLKANIADLDPLALINVFDFSYSADEIPKQKAIALLNIGASISNLDIIEDGIPRLSRDIHIAGNNITQKIADTFAIDFKAAEELKLNPAPERADKVNRTVESMLANLATEVRISFDFYESQGGSSVVKIFLSGGSSRVGGIKDMLANFLGIEVDYWDPLRKINLSQAIDAEKIKAISSQFCVALGLALR
jgi:type IV pilus assembly protein PilM